MVKAAKPALVRVETIYKTKKNMILFTLNSKEAVNWVREPGNEEMFANAFSKGSDIRDHLYNICSIQTPFFDLIAISRLASPDQLPNLSPDLCT